MTTTNEMIIASGGEALEPPTETGVRSSTATPRPAPNRGRSPCA